MTGLKDIGIGLVVSSNFGALYGIAAGLGANKLLRPDNRLADKAYELTAQCEQKMQELGELNDDTNEYFDHTLNLDYENLKSILNKTNDEIEKLMARVAELQKKLDDGTITEDEQEEMNGLQNKIDELTKNSKLDYENGNKVIADKTQTVIEGHETKLDEYSQFAKQVMDFALPLSLTKKHGGLHKKAKRLAGIDNAGDLRKAGLICYDAGKNLQADTKQSSKDFSGKFLKNRKPE